MKKKVIAVIEDEPEIQHMAAMVCRLEGHSVYTASNALDGIELIATKQIDLVLLDLRLPGYDGWFVLEKMRDLGGSASVPVVVFTASATSDTLERAAELGVTEYLIKPTSAEMIRETINKMLYKGA